MPACSVWTNRLVRSSRARLPICSCCAPILSTASRHTTRSRWCSYTAGQSSGQSYRHAKHPASLPTRPRPKISHRSPGIRYSRMLASRRKTTQRKTSLGYWALQLIGWSLYFRAQASGEVIFASVPWSKAATLWGGICIVGIGLTHLLRWVITRQTWLALPPAALLIRVIASVLLISLTTYLITVALSQAVYDAPVAPIRGALYHRLSLAGQL